MTRESEIEEGMNGLTESMIYKLNTPKNMRKTSWRGKSISNLLAMAKREIEELEESLIDQDNANSLHECADVANFMMMIHDSILSGIMGELNAEI